MKRLLVLAGLLFVLPARAEITIDWVTVGDPGNSADWSSHGAVAYTYQIGKYEVTNAQYAEFLNTVADTDTNNLYRIEMGSVGSPDYGSGITRSGSPGSFTYSAIAGREDMPVNYVSFYDSLRFANWLHNGQPTGVQDNTTTEDGAYTMIVETYPYTVITRNAGAEVFLTSGDEWYKAAYYDAGSASYFDYPAGSDTQTTCAASGATANTANCNDVEGDFTDVGSYTGSASPYGTFDQGGNLFEWNEAISDADPFRCVRGGDFYNSPLLLRAATWIESNPSNERSTRGFRVASNFEPFTCGNGVIEGTEACDDDGTTPGDGCDASCQIESGWSCEGEPSVCTEVAAVPSMSATGATLLGVAVFGIGVMGLLITARRRRSE